MCFLSSQRNDLFQQNLALIFIAFKYTLSRVSKKRRELVSCQLESKEEASVTGRVGANAPTLPAHELHRTNRCQEILLHPQSPTSLSLGCPGLWAETTPTPSSPPLFTRMHGPPACQWCGGLGGLAAGTSNAATLSARSDTFREQW